MYEPSIYIKNSQKHCNLGALCPVVVLIIVGLMIVMIFIGASLLLYNPLSSRKCRGLLGKLVSTVVMFPINVIT